MQAGLRGRQSGLRRRGRARSSTTCAGQSESAGTRVLLAGPVPGRAGAGAGAAAADAISTGRRASCAIACWIRASAAGAGCSAGAGRAAARSLGAVCQRASGGSRTDPWPRAGVSAVDVAVHAWSDAPARCWAFAPVTLPSADLSRRDRPPLVSHNFHAAEGSTAAASGPS